MTDADRSLVSGQIAQIVSDRELILNRGSDHGVEAGMYFAILDPLTSSVVDPETGEEAGGFKRVKVVVVAVESTARLTLARTFRTKTVNVGGSAVGLATIAGMLAAPKYENQVETLRLDDEKAGRPLRPDESAVKVGDPFEEWDDELVQDAQSITLWEK